VIYVLRFSKPLGNPNNRRGSAQYYVGYCEDGGLDRRLAEHWAGQGAKITAAAVARGLSLEVVLTLPGDRRTERAIKNQKNTARFVERQLKAQPVAFERLRDGDVFRHADGCETTCFYNDGSALWLQDSDSDTIYEAPFDALTEGVEVQFVGRRFCTLPDVKAFIQARGWRACVGE
jgi:predicted GIY-YIG superfamily endonuclease